MIDKAQPDVATLVRSLTGLRCWYVSVGGSTLPTFQLALGEKIPRPEVLRNTAHPEEYRRFEGEANLLVWCTWRLDGPDGPLTSSDDTAENITTNLRRLRGAKVRGVTLADRTWDLRVRFSNRLRLQVFCDHVPGDPSFDGNWELWLRDRAVIVGPGAHCEITERPRNSASHA